MAESERGTSAVVADLVAAIERAAADLALAEEPAGFVAALETAPPTPEAGSRLATAMRSQGSS
ncbi:MAG: hypothetical protein ACRELA_11920 [Candidatus Rokuibacteriota bacterium]